jgi:hypothetical protein
LIEVLVNNLSGGFKKHHVRVSGRPFELRDRGPKNDLAHGFRLPRRVYIASGHAVSPVSCRQKHAALQLAKVLTARDDLLTWVASFLKVNALDPLEIDHLGDKLFDRSTNDSGLAREHLQPPPIGSRRRRQKLAQGLPALSQLMTWQHQQVSGE